MIISAFSLSLSLYTWAGGCLFVPFVFTESKEESDLGKLAGSEQGAGVGRQRHC